MVGRARTYGSWSSTTIPPSGILYRTSVAQYVYQLEPQAAVLARIVLAGGVGSATDPRQGRNIGVSAIVAPTTRSS